LQLVGLLFLDGLQRQLFFLSSDGVFHGRFDLAALRGCHTLNVYLFVSSVFRKLHDSLLTNRGEPRIL
jgi:hypothetical protein